MDVCYRHIATYAIRNNNDYVAHMVHPALHMFPCTGRRAVSCDGRPLSAAQAHRAAHQIFFRCKFDKFERLSHLQLGGRTSTHVADELGDGRQVMLGIPTLAILFRGYNPEWALALHEAYRFY